jgi:tRNA(Ile2) C34 agmatinyltransferase TiaS
MGIILIREVSMQSIRYSRVKASADVISGILNCVCPECGGRMGGRGKEFKCQGQCQIDWRQTWELVLSPRPDRQSQRTMRPS